MFLRILPYVFLYLILIATVIAAFVMISDLADAYAEDGIQAVLNKRGLICLAFVVVSIFLVGRLFRDPDPFYGACRQVFLGLFYLIRFSFPTIAAWASDLFDRIMQLIIS